MPFDINCARCGKPVEDQKYYVNIDNKIDGTNFDIHVKLLSISTENEEHDFCKSCRLIILTRMSLGMV